MHGEPCFDADHPSAVSCVAFSPRQVKRQSYRDPLVKVNLELLAISNEVGHIYLYAVEWPTEQQRNLLNWYGVMRVLLRLDVHTQQVCGLAWSFDNAFLASGGNDNCACVFEVKKLLARCPPVSDHPFQAEIPFYNTLGGAAVRVRITLSAAIKALAFAPFSPSVLALGAGSNDRAIHFHDARTGSKLKAIDCAAQVTSLTWSTTRAEIAATFGFAQPDHRVRLAVYAWPSCRLLVAVEWPHDHRALWAVAFPRGPPQDEKGRNRRSRAKQEGCLVVAASDASIKFHEVWTEEPGGRKIFPGVGLDADELGTVKQEVIR